MTFLELSCGGADVVAPQLPQSPGDIEGPSVEPSVAPSPETNARPASRIEARQQQPAVIARSLLTAILDAGFGHFLRRVSIEPVSVRRRFVGFRILALEASLADGSGLLPGDVVLLVNDRSIERPEQALAAWELLRTATELSIVYSRDGQMGAVRISIANDTPEEP